ncbi:MarR family winged helix-turn-helix transcriptional regulator [Mangrovicoccus sp. HB161399]|uniref:MarR family winged helix-turn-helix transcriptional regulator n=1 Tax=Mangrovicoccus sp. HB161399 TaxID=2720392 RepID=UPI001555289B|nr:MarR family transcriptional regulator [Mangrovicoccus sp. HB161399]
MTLPIHKEFLPELIGLVRGVRKRFNARAVALDMTYSRAQALLHIARSEGLTQAELADLLDISTPSMNRTLDHLEEQELIERRSCEADKRIRRLFLTPKARGQAEQVVGFTEDLRREVYRGISPEDLERTLDVIRRIQKNLDGME